jgi:hypothetical protein
MIQADDTFSAKKSVNIPYFLKKQLSFSTKHLKFKENSLCSKSAFSASLLERTDQQDYTQ